MFRQNPVLHRINRIEGQLAGIKRMYTTGRGCTEIVQQVQAARAALASLAKALLANEARRCANEGNLKELEEVVNKTFKTI